MILSYFLFKFFMDVLGATNKPNRAHSKSMRINILLSCSSNSLVVCKAEVVVSTKIQDFLTFDNNLHALGALNDSFNLIRSSFLYLRKSLPTNILEFYNENCEQGKLLEENALLVHITDLILFL